jgi:hypothetical protein
LKPEVFWIDMNAIDHEHDLRFFSSLPSVEVLDVISMLSTYSASDRRIKFRSTADQRLAFFYKDYMN